MDAAAASASPRLDVEDVDLTFHAARLLRGIQDNPIRLYATPVFARDVSVVRVLHRRMILAIKPEFVERILLTEVDNYPKSDLSTNLLKPAIGEGLLLSKGEKWRRQRRIVAPAFAHKRVAGMTPAMARAAGDMLDGWARLVQPFDLAHELSAFAMRVIALTMFGQDLKGEVGQLAHAITELLEKARPSVLDMLGAPRWIPRLQPRFGAAGEELERAVVGMIAARRAEPGDRGDLLSMLMAARDEATGEGMDDRQLRDEVMTIFLAGHETTANALTWTFHLLAQNPEAEAKLHEEVDRALGGRTPDFADLSELKTVRRTLEEGMRLYPPAHSLSRTALKPDSLGGVPVPAGALITVSPYVTQRSPKLWEEPTRFDPDRFLPERAAGRHRFAYFPFGGGPRICVGQGFAMAEAMIALAMVAQRFRVRVESPKVEPFGRVTLRPKGGLWVSLERRPG